MGDNLRWFKVWCAILNDPHFISVDVSVIGRWTLLGAWVAQHGENGVIKVPSSSLKKVLRMKDDDDNDDVKMMITKIPNIKCIFDNDDVTVIINNWSKYQRDSTSYERLKRHRDKTMKRSKTKTKTKTKNTPLSSPQTTSSDGTPLFDNGETAVIKKMEEAFEKFWSIYPRKVGKQYAFECWQKIDPQNGTYQKIFKHVAESVNSIDWTENDGKWIPHPSTYINQQKWTDVYRFPKEYIAPEDDIGNIIRKKKESLVQEATA